MTLFAMRRANGDWFAIDDSGRYRVPVFHTDGDAMHARMRDTSMECFRPVPLDAPALADLMIGDEGSTCYLLIENPLLKLRRGRRLNHDELLLELN